MAEVRVAAQAAPPDPSFPLLALGELDPQLQETSRVEAHPPLIGREPYERLWAVINRLVRRGAAPAVALVVQQQNEWNAAALDTLHQLATVQAALQAEVTRLDADGVSGGWGDGETGRQAD